MERRERKLSKFSFVVVFLSKQRENFQKSIVKDPIRYHFQYLHNYCFFQNFLSFQTKNSGALERSWLNFISLLSFTFFFFFFLSLSFLFYSFLLLKTWEHSVNSHFLKDLERKLNNQYSILFFSFLNSGTHCQYN